jgi:hypothetical protein
MSEPPEENYSEILSGSCSVQVNAGDGMSNSGEAMLYDYVLYHQEPFVEIKANDKIVCSLVEKNITGIVMKSHFGRLTGRIWFNIISD